MGWWGSLFRSRPPSWSRFDDSDQFDAFIRLLTQRFEAAGIHADPSLLRSGSIRFQAGADETEWFLNEVAQACASAATSAWDRLIDEHLPGLQLPSRAPPATDISSLRLQILSDSYFNSLGLAAGSVVQRRLAEGLLQVLMLDSGGALERTVTPEMARAWGQTEDELFELGRNHATAADKELVRTQSLVHAGESFDVLVSNGFYTGAFVLSALRRLEARPGVILAPVSWHHWVIHSISAGSSLATLQAMSGFVESLAGQIRVTAAESLGTNLFWWHEGTFEQIPFEERDSRREPRPTPALAAVLRGPPSA
ncbi:hypothetical protein [Hyalangium versicolor]|uniref:hypothetical protein n=1 Tax=Hyalangium versicolor TaxID=2861190 RepID=UPI001CCFD627|nr:hypothetical protein [Hyalangium versicolor]